MYIVHLILWKKWKMLKMLENISIYLSCTFCLVLSLNHKNRSFFAPCACLLMKKTLYRDITILKIANIFLNMVAWACQNGIWSSIMFVHDILMNKSNVFDILFNLKILALFCDIVQILTECPYGQFHQNISDFQNL